MAESLGLIGDIVMIDKRRLYPVASRSNELKDLYDLVERHSGEDEKLRYITEYFKNCLTQAN